MRAAPVRRRVQLPTLLRGAHCMLATTGALLILVQACATNSEAPIGIQRAGAERQNGMDEFSDESRYLIGMKPPLYQRRNDRGCVSPGAARDVRRAAAMSAKTGIRAYRHASKSGAVRLTYRHRHATRNGYRTAAGHRQSRQDAGRGNHAA